MQSRMMLLITCFIIATPVWSADLFQRVAPPTPAEIDHPAVYYRIDGAEFSRARGMDVVMIDTAGRLPTQLHLMDELKKIKRVIGKGLETAPHEVLLVIDGNTGQNALAQVKAFDDALQLTGLIVTKLDGTAKGGVLAAIVKQRAVPVYFIGVGEGIDDLQPFVAIEFVDALLG
jgi:fused signal recognition particle receptor